MRLSLALLLLSLAPADSFAGQTAAPLQPDRPSEVTSTAPIGGWQAQEVDGRCQLARSYRSAAGAVTVAITPDLVTSDGATLTFLRPEDPRRIENGTAFSAGGGSAEIVIDGRALPAGYAAEALQEATRQRRVELYGIPLSTTLLVGAGRVEVAGDHVRLAFDWAMDPAGWTALLACRDRRRRALGIPAAELFPVADAANAIDGRAIDGDPLRNSESDVPPEAARLGQTGTATIAWRVAADGHVDTCRIVRSTGSPSLDTASCTVVRRARFRPARRGGRPVPSWGMGTMFWGRGSDWS